MISAKRKLQPYPLGHNPVRQNILQSMMHWSWELKNIIDYKVL